MPKYEVNKDGADEALDPEGSRVKVNYDKKDTRSPEEKSRTRRVVIIALVAICIIIVLLLCTWFVYTIVESRPEWQRDNFIIETIPGLRYHPENHAGDTMIIYNGSNPNSYKNWTNIIDKELSDYVNQLEKAPPNLVLCDYNVPPGPGEVCVQDIKKWFPCIKDNHYDYHRSSPCVFIRFNKILDWVPEFYDSPDALPEDMPQELKNTIAREHNIFPKLTRTVWLSCKGEDPLDVESAGKIRYIPKSGFPGFYFPYNNTENYLSPLVAVYFEKPQKGIIINIECKVWAKNIEYNKEKGIGYVHFELMVDY